MAAVLPLSFFVILVALYSSQLSPPAAASPGGWFSISNLTDPNVVRVANFSVTEYNQNQSNYNNLLIIESKSVSIFKGEIQVVNGLNYKLWIAANYIGKSTPNNFETVVYQKSDQNMTLTLVSFNITTN